MPPKQAAPRRSARRRPQQAQDKLRRAKTLLLVLAIVALAVLLIVLDLTVFRETVATLALGGADADAILAPDGMTPSEAAADESATVQSDGTGSEAGVGLPVVVALPCETVDYAADGGRSVLVDTYRDARAGAAGAAEEEDGEEKARGAAAGRFTLNAGVVRGVVVALIALLAVTLAVMVRAARAMRQRKLSAVRASRRKSSS